MAPAREIVLEIAAMRLPLRSGPDSGFLLLEEGWMAPLCKLANLVVTGYPFALTDRVQTIGDLRVEPEDADQWAIEWAGQRVTLGKLAVFECFENLMAVRQPDETFWLFRHDALFWRPSETDREVVAALETRAREPQPNPILRRALLFEMEAAGLFDEAGADWRIDVLHELGHTVLESYCRAARTAHEYFRSPERERLLPDRPPARLLERHVSVEWFRQPRPLPPSATLFSWTAGCEYALLRNRFNDAPAGYALQRWGQDWYRMHWIREDGVTPALDAADEVPR